MQAATHHHRWGIVLLLAVICRVSATRVGRSLSAFSSLPSKLYDVSSISSNRHSTPYITIRRSSTSNLGRIYKYKSKSSISSLRVKVSVGDEEAEVPFIKSNFNNEHVIVDEEVQEQLQSYFPFPLDNWQLSAGAAILAKKNVIVCAPTGAGKTVVGEMALRIALERNKKAIYTTPLKALSNQKFGEMRKVFGVENVGLATGDISIRRGADVTIMTTEVYRNMAWRSKSGISSLLDNADKDDDSIQVDVNKLESATRSERNDGVYSELSDNNVVVLDEFHYMGQKGRGSTWEECVIFNPIHTQIVGLSATLPNAHRLAEWMQSTTGRESILIEANTGRPVPLRYYFATKRDFSPLFRDEDAGPGAKHGLLGLRGDGVVMTPKRMKKNKGGFDKNASGINRNGLPRGLDLHPILQSAAERSLAGIERRIERIVKSESYDDGYSPSAISKREQRKMKENMLKAELRKSVPSVDTLVRRLKQKNLLPAIFFIFSRKGCDNAAEILCETLKTKAQEKESGKRRPVIDRTKPRKGKIMKGKGRGRGRRHSNNNDFDLNEDELAMVQDEDGRSFRADLLDQLLSDDFDATLPEDSDINDEDDTTIFSEKNIQYYSNAGLLDIVETREVVRRLLLFNTENSEIAFDDKTVEQLLCGIGSHHAGILPAHKAFVETLFRLELMRVVFATETLAAGINMPARTTVICSMAKRGDLGMELLETHNMLQMAGRAGRRGLDVEGACVLASTPFETADDAITILTNEIKPISSQFAPSYALAVNLIERGDGKLDIARSMVQKSFAVFESRQKEEDLQSALEALDDDSLLPEEQFMNTLQLTLEKELIQARDGTSPTGTSQLKESKLLSLVDILSDGKKLKKISKKYSGSAQILDLEQSTLKYLERELRELNEHENDDLPIEIIDNDKAQLMSEIKRQRQRVAKGEREVNNSLLSAMTKVANKRMKDEDEGSDILRQALRSARFHGADTTYPEGAPLEPGELNSYIKNVPKNKRRPLLDQTTSLPSDENDDDSWNNMLALIKVLEAYGCLLPSSSNASETTKQYTVTDGGQHVGSIGLDNSLWQLCALGGAWDVAYESIELDRFQEALSEFDEEDYNDEKTANDTDIPKPQAEAETLTDYLCQLSASELAGYVSSLNADSPRQSDSALESFQKLSYSQQRAVQGALLSLERLVEVQRRLGLDDSIGKCQLELSSCEVVTQWAASCSWDEALRISGAAPGDLVRILSRALDALRQLGNLPYVPARSLDGSILLEARGLHPRIRSLCREAANEMDRYPVKDMLPFEEDDEDEEADDNDEDEEGVELDEGEEENPSSTIKEETEEADAAVG